MLPLHYFLAYPTNSPTKKQINVPYAYILVPRLCKPAKNVEKSILNPLCNSQKISLIPPNPPIIKEEMIAKIIQIPIFEFREPFLYYFS